MSSGPVFPEGRTIYVGGKPANEQVSSPANDATPHGQQVHPDQLPRENADPATTRAAKKAAKKALHATPPAGAVIPTMGLRARQYAFNMARGRHDKVPPLGKKEQRLRAERLARETVVAEDARATAWLKAVFNPSKALVNGEMLAWEGLQGVVSVQNQKGGAGKTTLIAPLASKAAQLSKLPVLLLPIAANGGSTNLKAGANSKNTLSILELEALMIELTKDGTITADANKVFAKLYHNESGLFVVSQKAPPPSFTGTRLRWLVLELKKLFPLIFLDGGNAVAQADGSPGGNLEYMAAALSDLVIFPAITTVADSAEMMGETMDALAALNQDSKLARSLVVINAFRAEKDDIAYWVMCAEYKVERYTDETVRPIGPRDIPIRVAPRVESERPKAKLMLVPWDQHLVDNPIPDLNEVTEETHRVYLQILFEIAQRVAERRRIDLHVLDQIMAADAAQYDTSKGEYYGAFNDSDDLDPTTEQQHPAQDTPSGQAFSAVGHNR